MSERGIETNDECLRLLIIGTTSLVKHLVSTQYTHTHSHAHIDTDTSVTKHLVSQLNTPTRHIYTTCQSVTSIEHSAMSVQASSLSSAALTPPAASSFFSSGSEDFFEGRLLFACFFDSCSDAGVARKG